MRITRGNHLTTVWQHIKMFVMLLLAITATLIIYKTLMPVVAAEPVTIPDSTEVQPQNVRTEVQFVDGEPVATSADFMRPENALLTWSPTGTAEIQDTYGVRISSATETNQLTGELAQPQWFADDLTMPSFTVPTPAAGTYYWQVRSCPQLGICDTWSPLWSLTIDDTAPAEPTINRTGDAYDQSVSLTGTGEPESNVIVAVGDITIRQIVAIDGLWIVTFDEPFEFGTYEATVRGVDAAGNESSTASLSFSVKELFVAPQITNEELPAALDVIPVDETHENLVFKQVATSVIDVVNTGDVLGDNDSISMSSAPLTTDGGIVQSSQNGWRVLGVPWFLWAGIGGMLSASWFVSSGRLSRASIGL